MQSVLLYCLLFVQCAAMDTVREMAVSSNTCIFCISWHCSSCLLQLPCEKAFQTNITKCNRRIMTFVHLVNCIMIGGSGVIVIVRFSWLVGWGRKGKSWKEIVKFLKIYFRIMIGIQYGNLFRRWNGKEKRDSRILVL